MDRFAAIQALLQHGIDSGMMDARDEIYVRNYLLDALQLSAWESPEALDSDEAGKPFQFYADFLLDDAADRGVIPDSVTMGGSIRTFDEETRAMLKKRMDEIAGGIAQAFRAEADVAFGSGCPTLVNDRDLSACCETYVKELLGKGKAFSVAELNAMSGGGSSSKSAGSEDFAYVSQEVPSIMLALASGQPEKGYGYPQHHPMVKFDESVLAGGSAVYAYTALRWLEDHNG